MTPHQSFTDLAAITIAVIGGKISIILAQAMNPPDWLDRITGPMGSVVTMAIVIWWLQQRNAKQDAKLDERQKIKDAEDAVHKAAQIETARQLAETNTRLQVAIDQNTSVIETNSRALNNHPCTK
jgi:hypothetical protein